MDFGLALSFLLGHIFGELMTAFIFKDSIWIVPLYKRLKDRK